MATTKHKCLLVDDDHTMLELLSTFMEHLGYETVIAHDGDEGLTAYRECKPDLVVSDIHMPNRNGLALLADIREINPLTPVILITGFLHFKAVMNMDAVKPDLYIEKPFTLEQLRLAVESLTPALERVTGVE
jgi:DNA-binding NtrC family response regulator